MLRSSITPLSIPRAARLANPNRGPSSRRRGSNSVVCFCRGNKTVIPNSVTNSSTSAAASAKKIYFSVSAIPSISLLRQRPSPEIGLVSIFFVLSMVFGAFLSLGLISIPTIAAFWRLGKSASRLEKVVSREVPGTILSLKLSGIEISGITQLISWIRCIISGDARGSQINNNNHKRRV